MIGRPGDPPACSSTLPRGFFKDGRQVLTQLLRPPVKDEEEEVQQPQLLLQHCLAGPASNPPFPLGVEVSARGAAPSSGRPTTRSSSSRPTTNRHGDGGPVVEEGFLGQAVAEMATDKSML